MIGVFSTHLQRGNNSVATIMQAIEPVHQAQSSLCGCCGISIPKSVGVVYLDSNPNNLERSNLVAVCKVCESLHNGGHKNGNYDCGYLIYLPELPQVELIRLAYAAKGLTSHCATETMLVISDMRVSEINKLKKPVEKYLGFNDVSGLSDFLKSLKPKAYEHREKGLGAIRWFPDIEQFSEFTVNYKASFLNVEELESIELN